MDSIEQKAKSLVEFFKPIVYPYMGSGMLTNNYDDGVILQNAKICANKCIDEIINESERYGGYDSIVERNTFLRQVKEKIQSI